MKDSLKNSRLPQGMDIAWWRWQPHSRKIAYSDDWLAMAGLSAVEEATPQLRLDAVHPGDEALVARHLADCFNGAADGYEVLYRMQTGRWVLERGRVEERDAAGAVQLLAAVVVDVNTPLQMLEDPDWLNARQAADALARQDRLLHSVNVVATQLVTAEPEALEKVLWEALQAIGRAAGADRAYIWENGTQNGELVCTQTYEWSEGAQPQQGEDFTLSLPYSAIPYWRRQVMNNLNLNGPVKDLPKEERAVLEPQGILSILIIPIVQEGAIWGFIGFDDCHRLRTFTAAEEQVLQSAGILISSAMLRNRVTRRLVDALSELEGQGRLLRAVNNVASLVINDEADSDFVQPSLQLLAESVDADRSFIWRTNEENGVLLGTEICEWTRGASSFCPGDDAPVDVRMDSFLPDWDDTLLKGKRMNLLVKNMSRQFRTSSAARGVLATMNIPLTVHGEFWGIIGFDNMHSERLFTNAEMDILEAGGMLVAAAIARREMLHSLVEAREEALAGTRAKSEFLARMSHEIRTPLNAVIGMATLAKKSEDLDRVKYCLGKIDASSRQLLDIINDILDMSKIESGKFEIYPSEFDFEKMLQHTIGVVQVKLDEKHQELTLEIDKVFTRGIISDELRLSQVLINLLTNAIKFTPDFGTITLRIAEDPLPGGRSTLRVAVADNGIGMTAEQQAKLFTAFGQADGSISRQYGGTGLGLAICKKIVNLMDGDIWVESADGQGATFLFEVKVAWGSPLEKAVRTLRSDLRVLVVDDSPDVLDYFENILAGFGLECDTAGGGQAGVSAAQKAQQEGRPYGLVFVDWTMPGVSGAEAAGAIAKAAKEAEDDTIVVIISVADHADIEQEMKNKGLAHFLAKPVLPSVMYDTVVQLTDHTLVAHQDEEKAAPNWQDKRLLLAEDIDINREILMALLEDTGASIDCAENGQRAVEMFTEAAGGYDLVLMDVQMPVMDGLAATRAIRELTGVPKAATVPIIAMTANAFKEDVQNCLDAGMNGHVAKPVEVDVLMDTLAEYLG